MDIFWYPFLGSTAHALLCYLPPGHYCACSKLHNNMRFNFNAQMLQTTRCASARHVRTAHKLAANSSGASPRLAPVLDPNHVSGRIFFVIKHCGLRSRSSWMCYTGQMIVWAAPKEPRAIWKDVCYTSIYMYIVIILWIHSEFHFAWIIIKWMIFHSNTCILLFWKYNLCCSHTIT